MYRLRSTRLLALIAGLLAVVILTPAAAMAAPGRSTATPTPAPTAPSPKALVLYDTTGPYGYLGELYASQVANLAGHFSGSVAKPVTSYVAGEVNNYAATFYFGSTYDEPIPTSFLDDVPNATKPVLWSNFNIWQLAARTPDFAGKYGWTPGYLDTRAIANVTYKGVPLNRNPLNSGGILDYLSFDPGKAIAVATAVRQDGTTMPWAVRSRNLTYIGELPFPYANERDRLLIFQDLMFDMLAPNTPEQHRALVRLEDVGPDADPATLRAIADYLYARNVPFSIASYTRYRDPNGAYNGGVPEDITLAQRPAVVDALKYMLTKGGTLLMHGYTHQYETKANPYNGVSGDDFEFYLAHINADDYVVLDGPVTEDSAKWAEGRMTTASNIYKQVKLPVPTIFEFPHYAGSATDYAAANAKFGVRYDRGIYYKGVLSGGPVDHKLRFPGEIDEGTLTGQFFPYVIRDIYGSKVIPENMGDVTFVEQNHHPVRLPSDLVRTATYTKVVRDSFASFFYHPYLGLDGLKQVVEGVQAQGFQFVSVNSI